MSTNIAETSVTIDGVRFIIDSGKVSENFNLYENLINVLKLLEFYLFFFTKPEEI